MVMAAATATVAVAAAPAPAVAGSASNTNGGGGISDNSDNSCGDEAARMRTMSVAVMGLPGASLPLFYETQVMVTATVTATATAAAAAAPSPSHLSLPLSLSPPLSSPTPEMTTAATGGNHLPCLFSFSFHFFSLLFTG